MLLDQLLGWAVIAFPFLLSILFIFIPAKTEDEQKHMKWRWTLVLVGAIFSLLAWWQQSRALMASAAGQERAITETSQKVDARVAAETSASVTKTVTDLYSKMISDQKSQIAQLQSQLAAQGKDVSVIKKSNIVTGNAPVKVEVTNEPIATAPIQVENMRFTSEREASTHPDAPYAIKVTIQTDTPISQVRFALMCDAILKYTEVRYTDVAATSGGEGISKYDAHIYVMNEGSLGSLPLLRPDAPIVVHLYSDSPLKILRGDRGPR